MRRTIPIRADWFAHVEADAHRPPGSWSKHPMLGDLRVLCQPILNGLAQPVPVGPKSLRLDPELGLVRE
jgi:CRISPR-associated endonuclease/helicase Cas3